MDLSDCLRKAGRRSHIRLRYLEVVGAALYDFGEPSGASGPGPGYLRILPAMELVQDARGRRRWLDVGLPMHVASVSKLVTAMAMTKLLYRHNISPDAHILPWLPKYWNKGPGVEKITFRQLLTHTSRLVLVDEPGPSDLQFMKDQIAIRHRGHARLQEHELWTVPYLDQHHRCGVLVQPAGRDGCLLGPHDDSILRALCQRQHFCPAGVTSTLDIR